MLQQLCIKEGNDTITSLKVMSPFAKAVIQNKIVESIYLMMTCDAISYLACVFRHYSS